jgi:hypothetical protein
MPMFIFAFFLVPGSDVPALPTSVRPYFTFDVQERQKANFSVAGLARPTPGDEMGDSYSFRYERSFLEAAPPYESEPSYESGSNVDWIRERRAHDAAWMRSIMGPGYCWDRR